MRPPRLKLRTLLVLVAIATVGVGAVEYRRRAARYRAMAAHELSMEAKDHAKAQSIQIELARWSTAMREGMALGVFLGPPNWDSGDIDAAEARARWHARRRAAYLRCARYPWLSPPPDETKPEWPRAPATLAD